MKSHKVLLTGAKGFVGSYLRPRLRKENYDLICASRRPEEASQQSQHDKWVYFDVEEPNTMEKALEGCDSVVYLVHSISADGKYSSIEEAAARHLTQAAAAAGVKKIIYLGAIAPQGEASTHLRSRLRTGEILRQGSVPAMELRASMIIGKGSASWGLVRDFAMRAPIMLFPNWAKGRMQPVDIRDVGSAVLYGIGAGADKDGVYNLPGPETLSAKQILERVANLRGINPVFMDGPAPPPRLLRGWLQLIARNDDGVAVELLKGLRSDILTEDQRLWREMGHQVLPFDQAAREALEDEEQVVSPLSRLVEGMVGEIARLL